MIIQFNGKKIKFHVTNGRLRLYFYAGNIAHYTSTYEKVNKTDRLQAFGCNGPFLTIYEIKKTIKLDVSENDSVREILLCIMFNWLILRMQAII